MKKIFVVLFVLLSCNAFAQDLITKKDGTDIQAKVLEVTANEVRYRLYDEPDGVTYTARKSELIMIRYESGRKDIFSNSSSPYASSNRTPADGLRPGMKYKELKTIYNHSEYISQLSDRHSPGWSGVASFFIPGLGECINNEWGRGLGKFFGNYALITAGYICSIYAANSPAYIAGGTISTCVYAALACYAAAIGIDVWSIVDAVRIAKVKNMYEQDMRSLYAFDIDLYPSVNYIQSVNGVQPTVGFTLAMRF